MTTSEEREARFASMQKSKSQIVSDIIKNASFYFIEWILWLQDFCHWEWDENILLKIKFEWDDISPYQVIYLDKLTKKYLKDDDCNWYCRIKWQYFYITFEYYSE